MSVGSRALLFMACHPSQQATKPPQIAKEMACRAIKMAKWHARGPGVNTPGLAAITSCCGWEMRKCYLATCQPQHGIPAGTPRQAPAGSTLASSRSASPDTVLAAYVLANQRSSVSKWWWRRLVFGLLLGAGACRQGSSFVGKPPEIAKLPTRITHTPVGAAWISKLPSIPLGVKLVYRVAICNSYPIVTPKAGCRNPKKGHTPASLVTSAHCAPHQTAVVGGS